MDLTLLVLSKMLKSDIRLLHPDYVWISNSDVNLTEESRVIVYDASMVSFQQVTKYGLGLVNSNSFTGTIFLRTKWIFKLNNLFQFKVLKKLQIRIYFNLILQIRTHFELSL